MSTFASLRLPDFRLFMTGQFVTQVGTWVQRIAQDWLVLTLTGSVTAVGITSGLQSLPIIVFGPLGGLLADRYSKRRVLLAAQVAAATIAMVLAVLTFAHVVQAWHVYLAALALGIEFAIESPARNSFITELVGPTLLRNAASINSSTIQCGALIGSAISGALVNTIGFGWAFTVNAISYAAPLVALARLRRSEHGRQRCMTGQLPRLRDGLRYVLTRPGILWPTVLVGVFGTFTINLTITLAAYAKTIFHSGASGYGLLSSVLAIGSVSGALISARLARTRLRTLLGAAGGLAAVQMVATVPSMPALFCVALIGLGVCLQLFYTSATATVLLAAEDSVRGQVMGAYAVAYFGGGALGGPIVGWLDQQLGARGGMLLGGAIPALATIVIALKLARSAPTRRVGHSAALEPHTTKLVGR